MGFTIYRFCLVILRPLDGNYKSIAIVNLLQVALKSFQCMLLNAR